MKTPNRSIGRELNLSALRKKMPAIKHWLSAAGAEILEPTNEWEVLRFRSNGETSIVYCSKSHNLTFTGESGTALLAFSKGTGWTANTKTPRRSCSPAIATVRQRDGDLCFFCGLTVPESDESIDHLVALAHGGPNHISNFVLMHRPCNSRCGHMSASEKIRAHVEWQRH